MASPNAPGMAAGITDHIWSFRELLTVKFELIHNQSNEFIFRRHSSALATLLSLVK